MLYDTATRGLTKGPRLSDGVLVFGSVNCSWLCEFVLCLSPLLKKARNDVTGSLE